MGDLGGMRRRISGPVHGGDDLGRVDAQVGLQPSRSVVVVVVAIDEQIRLVQPWRPGVTATACVERGLAGVVRRG